MHRLQRVIADRDARLSHTMDVLDRISGLITVGEGWTVVVALCSLAIYARGWYELRSRGITTRSRFSAWRLLSFVAGWIVILVAVASPLDRAADRTLTAHMVQHLLLAMIAPPLLWLGAPAMPMLFGLPRAVRTEIIGPVLAAPSIRAAFRIATHPVVGWMSMAIVTLAWHVPAAYEFALRNEFWHRVEHLSMLSAGLLFWRPVVEPFPFLRRYPRITIVPYLVAADLTNTIVAAYLAFSGTVVYRWYAELGAARGLDALADQKLAAGLMWVPGSVVYLVPAIVITAIKFLPKHAFGVPSTNMNSHPTRLGGIPASPRTISLPILKVVTSNSGGSDLLRNPLIGRALRSPRARLTIRIIMLALASVITLDGLLGPQDAPMNLAGTFPWTHWRGITVIAILMVGNIACMACPLIAPRTVLRRWVQPTRAWPVILRSKWLAVVLVAGWLVAYEALDVWASPFATAGVIIGFFVVATAVDLTFEGASFCRYVCPLGQYQMLVSTVATREVRAIDADVCTRCTTHDCLRGRAKNEQELPGCGLGLFMPKKEGNLDCTFCLDCVSACPHGNIGVFAAVPGADLSRASWRSGIGTLDARVDLGVLASVFTVGAIANAAGMTAPVVEELERIKVSLGVASWLIQGTFVIGALAVGTLLFALAAVPMRGIPYVRRFSRVAFAAIPLGASVWLVHFGFHLVTGWPTGEASVRRVFHELALAEHAPDRIMSCCVAAPNWLLSAEILVLSFGLTASLGVLWWSICAVPARTSNSTSAVTGSANPWSVTRRWVVPACAFVLLWAIMEWIVFQPMEMRGTSGFIP